MRRHLFAFILAAVCCGCLVSCNEKPKGYRFVKVQADGKEEVEMIEAKNDTDALNQYFDRMEKIIVANIGKESEPFKAMYVISPAGDTLNTNKELLESVMKNLPTLVTLPKEEKPAE